MRKIITIVSAIGLIGNAQAGFNGDSVMSPNGVMNSPTIQQDMGTVQIPAITSSNANEIQYGTCPSGFKYQGSTVYPLQIRSVTTYYMNDKATGTSASGWTDLDSSCTKTEEQSIACPSGYTGNQLQRRTVATRDGRGYDYSAWNTYQNSCVYVPPVTCRFDLWRYMLREDVNQNSVRYSFFTNGSKSASYAGASPTWNGYRAGKLNRTDYFQDGGDSGNTIGYTNYYEICGPF
jgi:hypothetical protein